LDAIDFSFLRNTVNPRYLRVGKQKMLGNLLKYPLPDEKTVKTVRAASLPCPVLLPEWPASSCCSARYFISLKQAI